MFQPDTLVVVADGAAARFLLAEVDLADLREVRKLTNHHHAGQHRHHGGSGHDSAHHHEESKFAQEIAHSIAEAMRGGDLRDLVLVAPPHMLGDLRSALSHEDGRKLRASVPRDLMGEDARHLSAHLVKLLSSANLESAHKA
ncbi:MAG TPA: host attachment protein [Myxococcota bacterium]|nr:host attachment protein [Myxococcota bacterium]